MPLYRRLLGEAMDQLPQRLKTLHAGETTRVFTGDVTVERGTHPLAWLMGAATRLPATGSGPISVRISCADGGEQWLRDFNGHRMPSTLWSSNGLLCERLGLVRFGFALSVREQAIVWRVDKVSVLGLPLPSRWFSGVSAREFDRDKRYWFDITAALPVVGRIVRYTGWLHVD